MKAFYDMPDAQLVGWTQNAVAQADVYDSVLFADDDQKDAYRAAGAEFVEAQVAQIEAETAAKNATQRKNRARAAWLEMARPFNNLWQIDPDVSMEVRTKMQLPVRQKQGARTSPQTPTGLIVKALSNGSLTLTWDRNGNTRSTSFMVEKFENGEWLGVFATSGTRARMEGFPPGVPVTLRVRAMKGRLASAPSVTVSVYGGWDELREAA